MGGKSGFGRDDPELIMVMRLRALRPLTSSCATASIATPDLLGMYKMDVGIRPVICDKPHALIFGNPTSSHRV